MRVEVFPSQINGEITAPPSKSYAHRLMITAVLSGKKVTVKNVGNSNDVLATLTSLKAIGGDCEIVGNDFITYGFNKRDEAKINVGESGSTLRFFLPIVSALGIKTTFTGSERLFSRPIAELVDVLNAFGAKIENFTVNGKLEKGNYVVDGSLSSQFVSGLLFAMAILKKGTSITVKGEKVSQNYVDMTLKVISDFGIVIEKTNDGFKYVGGDFNPKEIYDNEGDYSGSAFILALGAINGFVKVNGLRADSIQGDKEIVNLLKRFGVNVSVLDNSVSVSKTELVGTTCSVQNIPDLAQVIAVLGAFSSGKTVIKDTKRLKLKESDRLSAITEMLEKANIKYEFDLEENLTVYGNNPKAVTVNGGLDHRTVMANVVLGLNVVGTTTVTGAEAVNKSYPNFFNDIIKLGGKINVGI